VAGRGGSVKVVLRGREGIVTNKRQKKGQQTRWEIMSGGGAEKKKKNVKDHEEGGGVTKRSSKRGGNRGLGEYKGIFENRESPVKGAKGRNMRGGGGLGGWATEDLHKKSSQSERSRDRGEVYGIGDEEKTKPGRSYPKRKSF